MPRVFLSHDWGVNGATHARVKALALALTARDIDVWIDDTHMKGNIYDAMCRGIDACDLILVFVTRGYLDKVNNGESINGVRNEFMYAKDSPHKLLPVRFDASLPDRWNGPVGMFCGSNLYVDLATSPFTTMDIERLVRDIRKRIATTSRSSSQNATPCMGTPKRPMTAAAQQPFRTIRERALRACQVLGHTDTQAHTHVIVKRLFDSLVSTTRGLPVTAQLAQVEIELGLNATP
jgi:hypothetical protein